MHRTKKGCEGCDSYAPGGWETEAAGKLLGARRPLRRVVETDHLVRPGTHGPDQGSRQSPGPQGCTGQFRQTVKENRGPVLPNSFRSVRREPALPDSPTRPAASRTETLHEHETQTGVPYEHPQRKASKRNPTAPGRAVRHEQVRLTPKTKARLSVSGASPTTRTGGRRDTPSSSALTQERHLTKPTTVLGTLPTGAEGKHLPQYKPHGKGHSRHRSGGRAAAALPGAGQGAPCPHFQHRAGILPLTIR